MTRIYDFTVARPDGTPFRLWDLHGQVLLITAIGRETVLTAQLQGLDRLSSTFAAGGLTALAFPEPALEAGAAPVTADMLGVSFIVLGPLVDDGTDAAPLFSWLSEQAPGPFGTTAVPGYTKFLIARDGSLIRRFAAQDDAAELIREVRVALAAPVPAPPPKPAPPPQPGTAVPEE